MHEHYLYLRLLLSFRRLKRAAQAALTKTAVQDYYPILTKETTILASALLTNPPRDDRHRHFRRTGASAIMSIVYDYPTLASLRDKAVEDIETFDHRVSQSALPGRFFVEMFPWMMYIPERSQIQFPLAPW